jgi:hypothetical protein
MDYLVPDARKQAERSSPPVRAAARMRIARVQSTVDPSQACITFEMALDEIRSLPGRDRDLVFNEAQRVANAVAPDPARDTVRSPLPKDFHS